MKWLCLTLICIFLSSLAFHHHTKEKLELSFIDVEAILKGFFEGLGTQEEFDSIIACIGNMNDIYDKIVGIIDEFKHTSFHDFNQVVKLISDIFECFSIVTGEIVPCIQSSSEVYEIVKILANLTLADIKEMVTRNILVHGPEIYSDISECIKDLRNKSYEDFGKNLGNIVVQIIFNDPKSVKASPEDVTQFIVGVLEGLKFPDVTGLMQCIDDMQDIFAKVEQIIILLEHIDFRHLEDIIKAVDLLLQIVMEIMDAIKPCADPSDVKYIQKIITTLEELNIRQLAINILTHAGKLKADLLQLMTAFVLKNYQLAGWAVGDFTYNIVFANSFLNLNFPIKEELVTGNYTPADFINFTIGLLTGLKFPDINVLVKCVGDLEDVFHKLEQIVIYIEHIDFKHFSEIMKALEMIFQVVMEVLEDIKPCADKNITAYILKLEKEILELNVEKLAIHLILHGITIVKDLIDLRTAFKNHDYLKAGKDIGNFVYEVLFSYPTYQASIKFTPDDFKNLVIGLLTGLRFPDIDVLTKCIDDMGDVYQKMLQIIQLLEHLDIKHLSDLIKALELIFQVVEEILNDVKPCADPKDIQYINQLIQKIQNLNIETVALNILLHSPSLIKDLIALRDAFSSGDYQKAGKAMGDFVYEVLFSSFTEMEIKFTPDDFKNLVIGLLTGLRFPDIDVLTKCIDDMGDVYQKMLQIIQLLEHLDIKHLSDLIKALELIFQVVEEILNDVKPCADPKDIQYINQLIQKIQNLNIEKVALNILLHSPSLIKDLITLRDAFNSGDYLKAGKAMGDFVYEILFSSYTEMEIKFTPDDFKNLVIGLLTGLRFPDIDVLIKCINDFGDVFDKMIQIVQLLENIDMRHLQNLVKALQLMFQVVIEILNDIKPCADPNDLAYINEIIQHLENIDILQLIVNVVLHSPSEIQDLINLRQAFKSGDYQKAGKAMGDFIYQVLFPGSQLAKL